MSSLLTRVASVVALSLWSTIAAPTSRGTPGDASYDYVGMTQRKKEREKIIPILSFPPPPYLFYGPRKKKERTNKRLPLPPFPLSSSCYILLRYKNLT